MDSFQNKLSLFKAYISTGHPHTKYTSLVPRRLGGGLKVHKTIKHGKRLKQCMLCIPVCSPHHKESLGISGGGGGDGGRGGGGGDGGGGHLITS